MVEMADMLDVVNCFYSRWWNFKKKNRFVLL